MNAQQLAEACKVNDISRLKVAVAALAGAIDRGECRPSRDELRALAVVCDLNHLHVEADRVRRWLGDVR